MLEFKLDLDGATNVILGDEFAKDCNKLRSGYILATKTLIRTALDNPLSDGYHLIYPILFCFRHYLELELKYFYSQFKGQWPKSKGHMLENEWFEVIKANYEELLGCPIPDQIKEYIEIYNKLDPRGDYFKYEFDTKDENFRKDTFDDQGKRKKWGDPCHVGLQSLNNDMEIIEDVFLELKDVLYR